MTPPRSRRVLSWAVGVVLAACAPKPDVVLIHPSDGDAARQVVQLEFSQTITEADNFVLRPDEFGGAAVDHRRGRVYVGSRDAVLLALDARSGEVVWEHPLTDAASGTPAVAELEGDIEGDAPASLLLVGTDNGVLHALDLATRQTRWRYETPGRLRGQPVVVDGTVYFANSRDQIYALDAATGQWRWQYEQEFSHDFTVYGRAGLTFVPASGDSVAGEAGILYTGFDNGRVAALGATSGEVLWLANLAPPEGGDFVDCDSTPWIDRTHGQIIVTGQKTGVHALSLEDGTVLWRFAIEGAATIVGADDGSLIGASSLQGVFALDAAGGLRWRTQVDPGVLAGPVVAGNTAFVTHSDRGLLAFDVVTGELLAQLRTGSGASTPPSYDPVGQRLYLTSNRGLFMSLRVADGIKVALAPD